MQSLITNTLKQTLSGIYDYLLITDEWQRNCSTIMFLWGAKNADIWICRGYLFISAYLHNSLCSTGKQSKLLSL